MSTLRALWRLNQKSYVQFDHIEKMCHFTLYNFVFMQIFVGATVKALWFFLKIMFVHFFFFSTKIVMSTLRALWRLNQKSYVQFDQIEKMCHFTLYNFVFMQIFCRSNR